MIEGNGTGSHRRKSSILIVARCIVALQERPRTLQELAREARCAKETSRRMVNHFLKAGMAEFQEWAPRTTTGHLAAIYRWKQ